MATADTAVLGGNCEFSYNSGSIATPVWSPITEIGDLSIPDLSVSEAVIRTRARAWDLNIPARMSISLEFTYQYMLGSSVFDVIRGYALARTVQEYQILDGDADVADHEGLYAPLFFTNFPFSEPLEEAVSNDCRMALGYLDSSGTPLVPSWVLTT